MSPESTEERILSVLEDDAQASYAEIAARAEVSKPTVRKYIDRLEDEGVIVGYTAEVDPKKLSGQSIAIVGIEVASERYVEVQRALKRLDAIQALYTSSGDHMLMAEVRAPDGDALGDVINDEIMAEVRAPDGDALGDVINDEIVPTEGVTAAHPSFLQERIK